MSSGAAGTCEDRIAVLAISILHRVLIGGRSRQLALFANCYFV